MLKLNKIQALLEYVAKDMHQEFNKEKKDAFMPEVLDNVAEHSSVKLSVSFAMGFLDDLIESKKSVQEIEESLISISCTNKNTILNQITAYEIKKAVINKYTFDLSAKVL